MLDETEWARVMSAPHPGSVPVTIPPSPNPDLPPPRANYLPALEEYFRITGFPETNYAALVHHRVSLYGPPCKNCGRPLRTPQAKMCVMCWERREPALE